MKIIVQRLFLFICLGGTHAYANVAVPHIFSDHAVLQRGQPVHIWGSASASEKVRVSFHQLKLTTSASSTGFWQVWLPPEAAGGPYTLTISGSANQIIRDDVMIGDVWIASGQSNMEFPLRGFKDAPLKDGIREISQANHPEIRMLLAKQKSSAIPLFDQDSDWSLCTSETAAEFSAVAYFFALEISTKEHVAIGLIDAAWGGTPAQSWISAEGIAYSNLPSIIHDTALVMREQGQAELLREQQDTMNPQIPHQRPPIARGNWWNPSWLYNGMISPLRRYTIKGVLWYQGEADRGSPRDSAYERVFEALITDWRRQWEEGDFPFLYVQLASYKADFGPVRDGQRRALALKNTDMVVTLDIGQAENAHPPDKKTVGLRLAKAAMSLVYGSQGFAVSPIFIQTTKEENAIRVWLKYSKGLHAGSTGIGDFEIAGEDGAFIPASARIEEAGKYSTIIVAAKQVANPCFVRYGWQPIVTHFVYNSSGMPLGTFTSEPFPRGAF